MSIKLNSSDKQRGLYAAVTARLSKVDVKKSLFSKRIKLPVNQSKCEILFDVSLLTAEKLWQFVPSETLLVDFYCGRRLTMEAFVLKDHQKENYFSNK